MTEVEDPCPRSTISRGGHRFTLSMKGLVSSMKKYFPEGPWTAHHVASWITTVMIMVHVGLAMAIFAGGRARFETKAYEPLIDYTDGRVWLWGLWILASSALMAVPFRWFNIIGLWIGMTWHICWMSCFMIATTRYENAVATPLPVYGGYAMICVALLTARVIDKPKE